MAQTRTFILPDIERRETRIFPVGPTAPLRDPLLMSLGNPQTREQAIQTYQRLGAEAVPGLVKHLRDPSIGIRMLALSALQYAWTPGTENAVLPFLKSGNDAEAKSAWYLLKQKTDEKELDQWAEENLLTLNPGRVEALLLDLESEGPDPERMMQLLQQPKYWKALLPHLARYTDPRFVAPTRRLAGQAKGEWLAMALAALIHQADRDPAVLQQLRLFLKDEDPRVREMAAEYFRWYGRDADLAALEEAQALESDLFVRATLAEAIRLMPEKGKVTFPDPLRPLEPAVKYGESNQGDTELLVIARFAAWREAAGYRSDLKRDPVTDAPWTLVPPTRSFLADRGKGFGFRVQAQSGPFAESVHLAQDVAWGEVMSSVVAVSPGKVKLVRIARESWGGLVVMEHQSPAGKPFCSLYGHLGPLITVRPGDVIAAGTKLGSLGRSYTVENGGYRSHLHFGIYNDAFGSGQWITGYMDPEEFGRGDHHWIDPYSLYPE